MVTGHSPGNEPYDGRWTLALNLDPVRSRSPVEFERMSASVSSQMLYSIERKRALSTLQIYTLPISMLARQRLIFRCPIPATAAAQFNAQAPHRRTKWPLTSHFLKLSRSPSSRSAMVRLHREGSMSPRSLESVVARYLLCPLRVLCQGALQ